MKQKAPRQIALDGLTGEERQEGPVECLGMTFESDEARRAYYLERLRANLADPAFHAIEGFPIGTDEDILRLSDPPYYTACPNPFIHDFLRHYGKPYDPTMPYAREPFAADVSEGKSDPIYNAHTYHTKVPHKAIMQYILHYTNPGDLVFDGFCGTGMTGVAAILCGDRTTIESIGYHVSPDGVVTTADGEHDSLLGPRRAILNDLSPAASFIAYNYNVEVNTALFVETATRILDDFELEYGWMYMTRHPNTDEFGRINYVVWSDVFICSNCQEEVVFWDDAVTEGEIREKITCSGCGSNLVKNNLKRAKISVLDNNREAKERSKRIAVLINYTLNERRYEKRPDEYDDTILKRIDGEAIPGWYPTRRIDEDIDLWYERNYRDLGIYKVDDFYQRRSLIAVSYFRREIFRLDGRLRGFCWFWFQSVLMGFSLLNRYLKNAFSQVNRILSGTLYVGSMHSEVSPWYTLEGKIKRLRSFSYINTNSIVSTMSTSDLPIGESTVDYIFTDPPFGSNIIYSDLSILWESWLNISTKTTQEAVVHRRKKQGASTIHDYTEQMAKCFSLMHKILKPGRWITVEFHNSKNAIWNSIQDAMTRAGFVIADVRTLDKQVQTFKQVTAAGAVKQDLVISAYKTSLVLEEHFRLNAGTEQGVWDFILAHLLQLPSCVVLQGKLQVIPERMAYLLFDRMIAFHLQHGVTIPISEAVSINYYRTNLFSIRVAIDINTNDSAVPGRYS